MEIIYSTSNDTPILRPLFEVEDNVGIIDVQGGFKIFDFDNLEVLHLGFVPTGLDEPYVCQETSELFFGSDGILVVKHLVRDGNKISLEHDRSYVFPPHVGKLRKPIRYKNCFLILDSYGKTFRLCFLYYF